MKVKWISLLFDKVKWVSLLSGALFSVGLSLSGMTRPAKVVGFLDVGGDWDPSLACVMGGALAVMFAAQAIARRLRRPLYAAEFPTLPPSGVDARLIGGALIFGAGWGLVGFCPGPALVAAGAGARAALVFVPAMAAGMGLYRLVETRARAGLDETGRGAERQPG